MTFELASRYLQRSRELGFWGSLGRLRARMTTPLVRWTQSQWWGWQARRGMSDAALLARTTGPWSSMEALLEHLAARPGASFMLPHDFREQTTATLNRRYPGRLSELIAAADAACRNELLLMGREFRFPGGIDWLRDPVTGRRSPLVHRSRVAEYLWSENLVDPIWVWELNRHEHFITLGLVFWLTGDERYAEAFTSQVRGWIESNPAQHGINWKYGLEVAIRLMAWTVAFQCFRRSPRFRQEAAGPFLKSLWQQAHFLSRHLQPTTTPGVVPNNHLIGEFTALVLVGAAFPEFRASAGWRDAGLRGLDAEAAAQTHRDGVNKEQATGYLRFVAELLFVITARSRQGVLPPVPRLERTLEGMLDYVCNTVTPQGTTPMWGDSPSGRALTLGRRKEFWDFRPLLSAGAALFGRADWKYVARDFDDEAFWLLGAEGLRRWEELAAHPPKQASRAFEDAGMFVLRDSWSGDTDLAFLRCGPFGLGGNGHCAHAHCDLLSVLLYVQGQPVLVDSGTYSYDDAWRDRFRLTAAHNTVMIDEREQALPWHKFSWRRVPEAKCTGWDSACVRGELPGEVTFSRQLGHPRPGVWELADSFVGRDEHTLEWFFHFAPGLALELHPQAQAVTVLRDGRPWLLVHLPGGEVQAGVRDSWYADQYGRKEANRALNARWRGRLESGGAQFRWRFELVQHSR